MPRNAKIPYIVDLPSIAKNALVFENSNRPSYIDVRIKDLKLGKNVLLVSPRLGYFKTDSQFFCEVYDSDNKPLFTNFPRNNKQYRKGFHIGSLFVVTVEVTKKTSPGIGKIYMGGTLSKLLDRRIVNDDSINYIYSYNVVIDNSMMNEEEIRFIDDPIVTCEEISIEYPDTSLGSSINFATAGTVSFKEFINTSDDTENLSEKN